MSALIGTILITYIGYKLSYYAPYIRRVLFERD